MKTIAFMTQKGGSGKTTLVVRMAVVAEQSGELVVIIDADRQASTSAWVKVRNREIPVVITRPPADIPRILQAAVTDGIRSRSSIPLPTRSPEFPPQLKPLTSS